jgi:hypothetical protein
LGEDAAVSCRRRGLEDSVNLEAIDEAEGSRPFGSWAMISSTTLFVYASMSSGRLLNIATIDSNDGGVFDCILMVIRLWPAEERGSETELLCPLTFLPRL